MKLGLRTLAFATSVLGTSTALAQSQPQPDTGNREGVAPTEDQRGLRGFEALLRPGYGSAGASSPVKYEAAPLMVHPDPGSIYDGSASPYGGGLAGQLAIGYRFLPVLSAGIYGEIPKSSTSSVS